ncbi:MAG: hypothetical protein J6334_07445, partial [Kiritimatiellae bacterium]|nr:hypothetical protein [Kiritimatiellia bacterium]
PRLPLRSRPHATRPATGRGALRPILAAALLVIALAAAGADNTPADLFREKVRRSTTLRKAETLDPSLGSRDLFLHALMLCEAGLPLEPLDLLFDVAEQMQDRNEASKGFGNFRWSVRDGYVMDYNAVEFCMEQGSLIWIRHSGALSESQRTKLRRLITFSIEGCLRHRVSPAYTNIAIMNAGNLILLGETFDRPEVFQEGEKRLNAILWRTALFGVSEYASPTYTGVDIGTLQTVHAHVRSESVKRHLDRLLTLFWSDVAATTFKAANRYVGTHSRDYDYLYGFGATDTFLRYVGLETETPPNPVAAPAAMLVSTWRPSAETLALADTIPRLVEQSWGEEENQFRTLWIGRRIALGISGACYHNMDIPLAVNFAERGPRPRPRIYFIADGRRDPYGRKPIPEGSGPHKKTLHLRPFWAGAQRNRDALGLVLYRPQDIPAETPTLESHLVFPADVEELRLDQEPVDLKARPRFVIPLREGQALFLRSNGGAVGVRVPWSRNQRGERAAAALIRDADDTMRLTVAHQDFWGVTETRADPPGAAFWVRVCDDADDPARFAAWMDAFRQAPAEPNARPNRIELAVQGKEGELAVAVAAPYSAPVRITPLPAKRILAVNGRDIGEELLRDLPGIQDYRLACERKREMMDKNTIPLSASEAVGWEAETGMLLPNMAVGDDTSALGGKYIWGPGEPGGRGGGPGNATWQIEVREAGRYYLWGRFLAPTPEDDSFFITIRQGDIAILPRTEWHLNKTRGFWRWSPFPLGGPQPIDLPAGKFQIRIDIREDGAKLDRLFITPNMGEGPQE